MADSGKHVALEVQAPSIGGAPHKEEAQKVEVVRVGFPWRPGPVDKLRAIMVSPLTQAALQLAAGQFVVCLFVFVRHISFSNSCLASIFYIASMLLLSLDTTVGSRLLAAASINGSLWVGVMSAGAMVSLAHAPGVAYTTFLCVFSCLALVVFCALRAAAPLGTGIIANLGFGITIVTAQFSWPGHTLWYTVIVHFLEMGLVAGLGTAFAGLFIFPTLARDELRDCVAQIVSELGSSISGYASHVFPPSHDTPSMPDSREHSPRDGPKTFVSYRSSNGRHPNAVPGHPAAAQDGKTAHNPGSVETGSARRADALSDRLAADSDHSTGSYHSDGSAANCDHSNGSYHAHTNGNMQASGVPADSTHSQHSAHSQHGSPEHDALTSHARGAAAEAERNGRSGSPVHDTETSHKGGAATKWPESKGRDGSPAKDRMGSSGGAAAMDADLKRQRSQRALQIHMCAREEDQHDTDYRQFIRDASDPRGDHDPRHAESPWAPSASTLRPQLLLARRLLSEAQAEPQFLSAYLMQLGDWAGVLDALSSLITKSAALESVLEGEEPLLQDRALRQLLGRDVLPVFRLLYAQLAASCAAIAKAVRSDKGSKRAGQYALLFGPSWGVLEFELAATLHAALKGYWQQYRVTHPGDLYRPAPQVRALLYVATLTNGIMESMAGLEHAVMVALSKQMTVFPLPHQRQDIRARLTSLDQRRLRDRISLPVQSALKVVRSHGQLPTDTTPSPRPPWDASGDGQPSAGAAATSQLPRQGRPAVQPPLPPPAAAVQGGAAAVSSSGQQLAGMAGMASSPAPGRAAGQGSASESREGMEMTCISHERPASDAAAQNGPGLNSNGLLKAPSVGLGTAAAADGSFPAFDSMSGSSHHGNGLLRTPPVGLSTAAAADESVLALDRTRGSSHLVAVPDQADQDTVARPSEAAPAPADDGSEGSRILDEIKLALDERSRSLASLSWSQSEAPRSPRPKAGGQVSLKRLMAERPLQQRSSQALQRHADDSALTPRSHTGPDGERPAGWWPWLWLEVAWLLPLVEGMLAFPVWTTLRTLLTQRIPEALSSRGKLAENTWRNRYFVFGLKFWVGYCIVLCLSVALSANHAAVRAWRPLYAILTVVVVLSEKIDLTVTRGVLRLAGSVLGGVLGFLVMLRPSVATSPYALTAIVCTFTCLCGFLTMTQFKYAVFLTLVTADALILCQYTGRPGSHGTPQYFYARVAMVSGGVVVVYLIDLIMPWYASSAALEQMGAAYAAATKLIQRDYEVFHDELERVGRPCNPGDAEKAEAAEKQDLEQTEKDILHKCIAAPLSAVQASLAREAVLWKHGILAMPKIVHDMLRCMLVLLDRLAAVELMLQQKPIVSGRYSAAPFKHLLEPIDKRLRAVLAAVVELGEAVKQVLSADKTQPALLELVADKIKALEHARMLLRLKYLETQRTLHDACQETYLHDRTPDDAIRFLSTIFALSKAIDKATLVARTVLEDEWMQQRSNWRLLLGIQP